MPNSEVTQRRISPASPTNAPKLAIKTRSFAMREAQEAFAERRATQPTDSICIGKLKDRHGPSGVGVSLATRSSVGDNHVYTFIVTTGSAAEQPQATARRLKANEPFLRLDACAAAPGDCD